MNTDTKPQLPQLLDRREISDWLACSKRHLDALVKRGMPHIRIGNLYRFDVVDVLAWLKDGHGADPEE